MKPAGLKAAIIAGCIVLSVLATASGAHAFEPTVPYTQLERICESMYSSPIGGAVAGAAPDQHDGFIQGCVGGALLRMATDPSSISFYKAAAAKLSQ